MPKGNKEDLPVAPEPMPEKKPNSERAVVIDDLMQYEGKKGLIALKEIADRLGMEYDSKIGKMNLIKQMVNAYTPGDIRAAMAGKVMAQQTPEKEETTVPERRMPTGPEEAAQMLPSLFYSNTDMIAAARAYGLTEEVSEDATMRDAIKAIVNKGEEVWKDFIQVEPVNGDMTTPEFYLQKLPKGLRDDRGALLTAEQVANEYNEQTAEGKGSMHVLPDSKGKLRWAVGAEDIRAGKWYYIAYHFGDVLKDPEDLIKYGNLKPEEVDEYLKDIGEKPKKGKKKKEKKEKRTKAEEEVATVAELEAELLALKQRLEKKVAVLETRKEEVEEEAVEEEEEEEEAAPPPKKEKAVSVPPVKEMLTYKVWATEDQAKAVAAIEQARILKYELVLPDEKIYEFTIQTPKLQPAKWQEAKVRKPPFGFTKEAAAKVMAEEEEAEEAPEEEEEAEAEVAVPAEELELGIKDLGMAHLSDFKLLLSSVPEEEREEKAGEFGDALVKKYPNKGKRVLSWLMHNADKYETKLTDSVRKTIDSTGCEGLSVLTAIAENTDSERIKKYIARHADKLMADVECVTKAVEKKEAAEEDLTEEVRTAVGFTIPFIYDDLVVKGGKMEGTISFTKTKAMFKEGLGIDIKDANDPLYVAIKKQRRIPEKMVYDRMGLAVVGAPEKPPTAREVMELMEEKYKEYLEGVTDDMLEELIRSPTVKKDPFRRKMVENELKEREWAAKGPVQAEVEETVEKLRKGIIDESDIPDYLIKPVSDAWLGIAKKLEAEPKEVRTKRTKTRGIDRVRGADGKINFSKFIKELKARGVDISNKERNKEMYSVAKRTGRLPIPGVKFRESWQEFQHRMADMFGDALKEMAVTDRERMDIIMEAYQEWGKKGLDVPRDFLSKDALMTARQWMHLYTGEPYNLEEDEVKRIWKKYGIHGKWPPETELQGVPQEVLKYTTVETLPHEVDRVLKWVDRSKRLLTYDILQALTKEKPLPGQEYTPKARQLEIDLKDYTEAGQTERFRQYFEHLAQYEEGREKLRNIGLILGIDTSGSTTPLDTLLSGRYPTEDIKTGYSPKVHREVAIDALMPVLAVLYTTPGEQSEFDTVRGMGAKSREYDMVDRMEVVEISPKDINAVTDKELTLYYKYKDAVDRDVDAPEFFAANPEISRKQARAIVEKADLKKSWEEYGERGRKPLGESELKGALEKILKDIKGYKYGEKKNRLAANIHNLGVLNREWKRRKGVPYVTAVPIDQMGDMDLSMAAKFADNFITAAMIPEEHREKVRNWMKEQAQVPGIGHLKNILADEAEAQYISDVEIGYDIDDNVLRGTLHSFDDAAIQRMGERAGMTTGEIREAVKAYHERRELPQDAIARHAAEVMRRQRESARHYEEIDPTQETIEKLNTIIVAAPDRATAIQKISNYKEYLESRAKEKESARSMLSVKHMKLENDYRAFDRLVKKRKMLKAEKRRETAKKEELAEELNKWIKRRVPKEEVKKQIKDISASISAAEDRIAGLDENLKETNVNIADIIDDAGAYVPEESLKGRGSKAKRKVIEVGMESIEDQIDDLNADLMQINKDIERTESDLKERLYKEKPEDYLQGMAGFVLPTEAKGEELLPREDREYDAFTNFQVYVRSPTDDKREIVTVDLQDIYEYWIDPMESGLKRIIDRKAKDEQADPYFKENFDKYKETEEKMKASEKIIAENREEANREGTSQERRQELNSDALLELEVLHSLLQNIRDYKDNLTTYTDHMQVEPTIKDLITVAEKTKKTPADWKKRVATIAFMNKARDSGLYAYFYQMARLGQRIYPPLKRIPLTIYPSDAPEIRDKLFMKWLRQGLSKQDLMGWEPHVLKAFVGEDWDDCKAVGIFGAADPARGGGTRDQWQECAMHKAKIIQSQAIARADPKILQPIIERVVRTEFKADAEMEKELKKAQERAENATLRIDHLTEQLGTMKSDKEKCDRDISSLMKQLKERGIVVAEKKGKKIVEIVPVTAVKTEEEKKLVAELQALKQREAELMAATAGAVQEACSGDESCMREAMKGVKKVEKKIRTYMEAPVPAREVCFSDAEWDAMLIALSERKKRVTDQYSQNRTALDAARERGMKEHISLYENMEKVLRADKEALDSIDRMITDIERSQVICSPEEMKARGG